MVEKGFFLSIEGGEGAGKTTLIERICEYMNARQIEVVSTREPGGIEIAEQIRSVILDVKNTEMDGRTEALLYAAARRQHLVEKVIPALREGKLVICDRFVDSSLAYQGYARGLGIDEIYSINKFAIEDLLPDLTLYMDLSPEVGLQRISANAQREVNRLDLEAIDFHRKVRDGYLKIARMFPDRIRTINAEESMDEVLKKAIDLIQEGMNR